MKNNPNAMASPVIRQQQPQTILPNAMVDGVYITIYPWEFDIDKNRWIYGLSQKRVHISPLSWTTAEISGYTGTFTVYPYDKYFAELDNHEMRGKRFKCLAMKTDLGKASLEVLRTKPVSKERYE